MGVVMTRPIAPPAVPVTGLVNQQLRWVTIIFTAALIVHGADHLRRGMNAISSTVMALGTVQQILALTTIVLVYRAHRWAPLAAVIVGFGSAVGFTLVHVFPDWFGPFSDSFLNPPASSHVNGFSWFAAGFEILASLALGIVGLRARRNV